MKKVFATILICTVFMMALLPMAYAQDEEQAVSVDLTSEVTPEEDGNAEDEEATDFAEQSDSTAEETIAEYYLSLDEAIEMAYTDNPQISANEYKQAATKINIKSAKIDKGTLKDSQRAIANANIPGISGLSVTTIETLLVREGYLVEAAEMQDRLAVKEADKIKASIAYNVTEAYYNLVFIDKLVNAANNAYDLALENKAIVDAQFELGLIPQIDYENADVSVMSAKSALDTYELNKNIAVENLKIHLGLKDENSIIIPTDEIECDEFTSDVNADLESALTTRYDLTALREQRDLAKKYFDISGAFTSASAVYNTAYSDYIAADYNYTTTSDLIGLSIRSSYNTIVTSKSSMDISQRQYEMKLKEYQSDKMKYDLGMISNIELTVAINDLYNAQVSYANAKLTYRMAVEKYKYEITIGL